MNQTQRISLAHSLRTTHLLLAVQTVAVILGSINRLSSLTAGYVAENEFLRWVDFHNMLTIALISLIGFYLLKKQMEYDSPARDGQASLWLNVAFVVGVYLLGASYGDHEVTNYLHGRFCLNDSNSAICRIIIFNDDAFSHWLFFLGFVLVNGALLFWQVLFPFRGEVRGRDIALLGVNGLFIGLGILANLGFEEIGFDLYVVALLAALTLYLLWRYGRQPLLVYYGVAYLFGLGATFVVKLLT